MTRTGLSIGTPRYMSPEQIRGQDVDARADLYSFGILFYEMLTGNVPYKADDSFALAMMHVTAPIPDLPLELRRFQPLLNKLLDKNPNQRFQDGQEFIAALDNPETIPIGPLNITDLTRKGAASTQPRRLSWKAGALAAMLAGVALAGGSWFWFLRAPPAPPPLVVVAPTTTVPPAADPAVQRRAEAEQRLAQARQRQQDGALEDSLNLIDQGLQLVPDHPELLTLREQVNRQITDAQTLKIWEEQRQQAKLQADQFLEQAQRAQQEGALDRSLVHIEQGLQSLPDHPGLLTLKREVQAQLAKNQSQSEAARQQAAAEERRKADQARLQADAEQRRRKADEFLARALDSQRNRAYETSLMQIDQGLQQAPDHSRLSALRDEVRRQLRDARAAATPVPTPVEPVDRVAALLRECAGHLQANRLISGKGGNAADCYGSVLKRDPGNPEARAGLAQIADRYADLATTAMRRGDTKAAQNSLDKLEQLNRSDPRIAGLREQLAARTQPVVKTQTPPPEQVETEIEAPSTPIRTERPTEAKAPPLDLVSVPQPQDRSSPAPAPSDAETRIIAQDRHARLSRTETGDSVSMQVTVAPQGILDGRPSEPSDVSAKPGSAEQAWAAIKNSADPAEIEQFLSTYPKSRQASSARAKLKQLQQQPSAPTLLKVRANLDDAEVWINGRNVGTTPLEVELKPGSYKVRVRREGYTDWNGQVDLRAGDESALSAVLPRKPDATVAKPATPPPVSEPEPEPEPPKPRVPDNQTVAKADQSGASTHCLRGNCENGEGTYRYPDGSEYSGQFRDAKMHGQGTYVYAGRGEKYTGEWRNGVINGQGTYYYRSGNRYNGEWRNGRKHGQGTYLYADRGDKYVGDFANDQPSGQGVYYYSNGDRYEGEWRNGRKNGQGVLYEGGQKIVGEWQNDQKIRVKVEP